MFSQAFFKALSNNQILLVLVRFVTLFNLQGTCRVPQRIQMISHLFPFVKLFFQVFSNFFRAVIRRSFSVLSSRRPRRRLAYHTRGEPLCQPPFLSFFKLFSEATVHSLGDGSLPWPQGPAAKRLVILPDCFSFVNTFFRDFLIFSTHSQNTPFCP